MRILSLTMLAVLLFCVTLSAQEEILQEQPEESSCNDCGNPKAEPGLSLYEFFSSRIKHSDLMKRPFLLIKIIVDSEGNPKCKELENWAGSDGIGRSDDTTFNYLTDAINRMPRWAPAVYNGRKVNSEVQINISLRNNKLELKRLKDDEELALSYDNISGEKEIPNDTVYVSPSKTKWNVLNHYTADYPSGGCTSVTTDSSGVIWAFTSEGIVKIQDGKMKIYENIKELGNIDQLSKVFGVISIGKDNRKYITLDYKNVIIEYNDTTWRVINTGYEIHSIRSAFKDTAGNLWFSSSNGLIRFDGKEVELFNKDEFCTDVSSFSGLFIGSKGGMWIGTHKGSIYKKDRECTEFNKCDSLLKNKDILKAVEDKNGNIWFLLYDDNPDDNKRMDQIAKLSADGKWFFYNMNNSGINSRYIVDFEFDINNNNLWIACQHGGIVNYDGKLWTIFTPNNADIPSTSFYGTTLDKEGNLWAATNGGLFHIIRKK